MANLTIGFYTSLEDANAAGVESNGTTDGRLLFIKTDSTTPECCMYFEHRLSASAETPTRMAVTPCPTSKIAEVCSGIEEILEENFRT